MQSKRIADAAFGGLTGAPSARTRAALILLVSASVIVAITAAPALPSRSPDALQASSVEEAAPLRSPVRQTAAARRSPAKASDAAARRFTGRVGANLTDSLSAAGVPGQQGREYVAVLARAMPLAGGLSVDDRFDLVVERRPDGTLGQLLYIGLDRVGRPDAEFMKWTNGKEVIWVNADGVGGESSAVLRMPVPGRVTSSFGERFHPILGYTRMHDGVDLGAASGTPIVAAADGRVVAAGWRGGYGRQVAIVHDGGIETTYSHMSTMAAYAGELVRSGQVIGYVGASGLATGPHLHFEVIKNGRRVNPLTARLANGPAQLEGEKLHRFHDELRALLLLPGA
jgi:murein DD-endopeptidase MepM/ murein hydrolase activator NlpD